MLSNCQRLEVRHLCDMLVSSVNQLILQEERNYWLLLNEVTNVASSLVSRTSDYKEWRGSLNRQQ